jgi:hypothetical protein
LSKYVVVSSITYAYKGKEALERKGYSAYIQRAPADISDCQCHYIIKIKGCPIERAVAILNREHVKFISTGGAKK